MSDTHLSEIFPLSHSKLNFASFRLSPEVDKKIGNSFAWYFSKYFLGVVAIYEKGYFWILSESHTKIPSHENWKKALEETQEKAKEKVGDRSYFIQWVNEPEINVNIIAQLAVRILKIHCRVSSNKVFSQNKVVVKRECNFRSEVVEINNTRQPAITLTAKSAFLYSGDLEEFLSNHPYRNDPEELLLDLQVRDIENNSTAYIIKIGSTIGEQRQKLLQQAQGSVSKEKLLTAPEKQPVVGIQFGKNSLIYDYAMAALRPCITAKTASVFDIEYGELLKHTKISYEERQKLLTQYKQEAHDILVAYGLELQRQCINNKQYSNLFWIPQTKLEDTLLLFGNGVIKEKSQTLRGLSSGGVYRRHSEFKNSHRKIRFAIINFTSLKVQPFFQGLSQRLNSYKFKVLLPPENVKSVSLDGLSSTEAKVVVQASVDEVMRLAPDIVLVFLPESDRGRDDSNGNSLYCQVYNRLLRRQIASQFIYEKTLNQQYSHILNQVVPGILAKLGNLPFVLAKPLSIADYFIGLDVSRKYKQKLPGSINACASLRLYGKQGEFIRYQLADDSITDGEEIPERILQDFLPLADLKNKRVLIYRDGIFRGDEIKHILEWGKAIKAEFILVECLKSGIPRLYNVSDKKLQRPTRGLALRLLSHEAILVTTQVSPNVGIPRPLRLKIREEGLSASIETLIDTTLKLTLLHHGSLKDPRLPIPLFGADIIAYRRLQGIYPGALEGDKQYWL